jgi:hypothetical protein
LPGQRRVSTTLVELGVGGEGAVRVGQVTQVPGYAGQHRWVESSGLGDQPGFHGRAVLAFDRGGQHLYGPRNHSSVRWGDRPGRLGGGHPGNSGGSASPVRLRRGPRSIAAS